MSETYTNAVQAWQNISPGKNYPLYGSLYLCELPITDQTIRREMIAVVNHDDLSFELLVDEESLWTGTWL